MPFYAALQSGFLGPGPRRAQFHIVATIVLRFARRPGFRLAPPLPDSSRIAAHNPSRTARPHPSYAAFGNDSGRGGALPLRILCRISRRTYATPTWLLPQIGTAPVASGAHLGCTDGGFQNRGADLERGFSQGWQGRGDRGAKIRKLPQDIEGRKAVDRVA